MISHYSALLIRNECDLEFVKNITVLVKTSKHFVFMELKDNLQTIISLLKLHFSYLVGRKVGTNPKAFEND